MRGGAIFAENASEIQLSGCIFEGCRTTGIGGALYVRNMRSFVLVRACTFLACTASQGGALGAGEPRRTRMETAPTPFMP